MKIGILQFAPELGEVEKNIARVNALLENAKPGDFQILVLPELAFSGYNFPDTASITPYLEPTASGPTATWARQTASRLSCIVSVGYPELSTESDAGPSSPTPTHPSFRAPRRKRYNSLLTTSPSGALLAHYRKTNLYYTDATWAWPSPAGFRAVDLALPEHGATELAQGASSSWRTAFAICMDFNPHRFTAPWGDYELARHVVGSGARLLVAANAWLTHLTREELEAEPGEWDGGTLAYWVARLGPVSEGGLGADGDGDGGDLGGGGREGERIVVIANRVGIEPGVCRVVDLTRGCPVEDGEGEGEERSGESGSGRGNEVTREMDLGTEGMGEPTVAAPGEGVEKGSGIVDTEARYAGSSCVMGFRGDGLVRMYGVLGRAEEKLLVVDTDEPPAWVGSLVSRAEADEEE